MTHTITTAYVETIYKYELTRGKSPADVWRAVRTKVHGRLQEALPPPSREDVTQFAERANAATAADAKGSVGGRARAPGAKGQPLPITVGPSDELLYAVQKAHGGQLWVEADRLVAEAGITETGKVAR